MLKAKQTAYQTYLKEVANGTKVQHGCEERRALACLWAHPKGVNGMRDSCARRCAKLYDSLEPVAVVFSGLARTILKALAVCSSQLCHGCRFVHRLVGNPWVGRDLSKRVPCVVGAKIDCTSRWFLRYVHDQR